MKARTVIPLLIGGGVLCVAVILNAKIIKSTLISCAKMLKDKVGSKLHSFMPS
jgi:hypothetical protein